MAYMAWPDYIRQDIYHNKINASEIHNKGIYILNMWSRILRWFTDVQLKIPPCAWAQYGAMQSSGITTISWTY